MKGGIQMATRKKSTNRQRLNDDDEGVKPSVKREDRPERHLERVLAILWNSEKHVCKVDDIASRLGPGPWEAACDMLVTMGYAKKKDQGWQVTKSGIIAYEGGHAPRS